MSRRKHENNEKASFEENKERDKFKLENYSNY